MNGGAQDGAIPPAPAFQMPNAKCPNAQMPGNFGGQGNFGGGMPNFQVPGHLGGNQGG